MPRSPVRRTAAAAAFALVAAAVADAPAAAQSPNLEGLAYYALPPCRVLDTRPGTPGPGADGPLTPGVRYSFDVAGGDAAACGVPATARAAMLNLVAVSPGGAGHLVVWPYDSTGAGQPLASVINFVPGENVANGVVVTLCDPATALDGSCAESLWAVAGVSSVHLVADVTGYFAPPGRGPLWGEGRPGARRFGRSTSQFFPNFCSDGEVSFGLSDMVTDHAGAAAACPAGTWVCTLAERGATACDTARPDDNCDGLTCSGSCYDIAAAHVGWVADHDEERGVAVSETGNDSFEFPCYRMPVWCCAAI